MRTLLALFLATLVLPLAHAGPLDGYGWVVWNGAGPTLRTSPTSCEGVTTVSAVIERSSYLLGTGTLTVRGPCGEAVVADMACWMGDHGDWYCDKETDDRRWSSFSWSWGVPTYSFHIDEGDVREDGWGLGIDVWTQLL